MKINKELIGNLIILLANRCTPLYHTKLLKLLYLIDEEAVKDDGIPITWLDYKVWQYGPVDPEVFFIEKNFNDYIGVIKNDFGTLIEPVREFSDLEFSEYNFEIIDKVLDKYKDCKSRELVDLTHMPNSLWTKTKRSNNIDFEIANISDCSMDLGQLVEEDEYKYNKFKEALEYAQFRYMMQSN